MLKLWVFCTQWCYNRGSTCNGRDVLKQLPSLWMKYLNLFCSFMTWSDSLRLIHHICSLTYPFLRQAGWFWKKKRDQKTIRGGEYKCWMPSLRELSTTPILVYGEKLRGQAPQLPDIEQILLSPLVTTCASTQLFSLSLKPLIWWVKLQPIF